MGRIRIFVDGSFNSKKMLCSYGVVILDEEKNVVASLGETIDHPGYCNMRNVGGEILGAEAAIKYALEHNLKDIEILYDYQGVGSWGDRQWKTNNQYTERYANLVAEARKTIQITFIKVKSHSGDKHNDMADGIAKDHALL